MDRFDAILVGKSETPGPRGCGCRCKAKRKRDASVESLDYWRLCDELSVVQAALLIIGEDPAKNQEWVEGWKPDNRPTGYDAARAALTHAILSGKLLARIRRAAWERGWDEDPREGEKFTSEVALFKDQNEFPDEATYPIRRGLIYRAVPDWHLTTVQVSELRKWLAGRGFKGGFFFPDATDAPDYLDPSNPRYAPKMAAAVRAWQEVTDPSGKHPKQALAKWLRENAAKFGMTDEEGKPNETGIEEAAKVANWQPGGGAPKTPGE